MVAMSEVVQKFEEFAVHRSVSLQKGPNQHGLASRVEPTWRGSWPFATLRHLSGERASNIELLNHTIPRGGIADNVSLLPDTDHMLAAP